MDALAELMDWYDQQCVDEWHEEFGVRISTLDNPGWELRIDLERTSLSAKAFTMIECHRSEIDWIVARRDGNAFIAWGGAKNLKEMVETFLGYAESGC